MDEREHEQYPTLRELAESADVIEVPAAIVRELFAERDALRAVVDADHDEATSGHVPIPQYHDDALLTLALAADVLNVSYSTVTKWTARGEFCPQAFKLPNGRYRVRYRDLIRWALSMRGTS